MWIGFGVDELISFDCTAIAAVYTVIAAGAELMRKFYDLVCRDDFSVNFVIWSTPTSKIPTFVLKNASPYFGTVLFGLV